MDKKLKEAMELIGGRAIIQDGDQYFAVMSLKEFRRFRQGGIEGLTKQELVDKINNDIAIWKTSQEESDLERVNLEEIAGE